MNRTTPQSLEQWTAGGRMVPVRSGGRLHHLFVRQDGSVGGPDVTLLHGFPTSSHDWSAVVPTLTDAGYRVTTLDFLGFGASDKPARHEYSVMEQADLVEAVWAEAGIASTALVAHDYGVSVGQELLARAPERIDRMAWLNGGLYSDLHRPVLVQRLLHGPFGPLLVRAVTERGFAASMRRVLGREVSADALHEMWVANSRGRGHLLAPRLLGYIDERRKHAARWVSALETFSGPVMFLWGPADPISGGHVLPRIRQRMPHATVVELDGPPPVGHYPQVEAADEVAEHLAAFLRADLTDPDRPSGVSETF